MRIMFIGRFQPFHKGHLEVVRHLLEIGDVMIVIGSAQYSETFRNPFTFDERQTMIEAALWRGAGIEDVRIFPVDDIHDHKRWAGHVKASVPNFDVVFSNSKVDREIFKNAGNKVLDEWLFERDSYEGKKIREALASGSDEWKQMVPTAVAAILVEIGAQDRLRTLKEKGQLVEEGNLKEHAHNMD